MAKLKEYIEQIRGVSYKPEDVCASTDADAVAILRANNIQYDGLAFDDIVYVKKDKVSIKQYIQKGDIVVCASSGSKNLVGKAAMATENLSMAFGAFCKVVRPKKLMPRYIGYFFQSPKYRSKISELSGGANINNIRNEHIDELDIAIVADEEQERIINKLDVLSNLISLRKQQLSKLDELVKSRFIELFGDPKHSDKYSTRKLSSCVANKADMVDGPFGSQVNTKVDYIENGEIPVIRTVNVKMMQFSADDLKFMSREKYETVIRSQVLPGDVILTKVGTIGNVCIFPNEYKEAVLSTTGSCRIRVDESIINKVFFAYNLMYLKDKLLEIASTGVQPFLNMNHIKNIDVLDVPFEEQLLFATFVEQVDKSKLEIQKSLEKLETLKKALMQKYFG